MQVQVDIGFNNLLNIIKNLPAEQLFQLKKELDILSIDSPKNEFRDFLLNGPTFSEEQIKIIEQTREEINKWRAE